MFHMFSESSTKRALEVARRERLIVPKINININIKKTYVPKMQIALKNWLPISFSLAPVGCTQGWPPVKSNELKGVFFVMEASWPTNKQEQVDRSRFPTAAATRCAKFHTFEVEAGPVAQLFYAFLLCRGREGKLVWSKQMAGPWGNATCIYLSFWAPYFGVS